MTDPIVDIIYGGQYGSEAKRLFSEFYYDLTKPTAIVSNFGPNSGGFVSDGGKWATFSMGADCLHILSPGSIIDLDDFEREKANLPASAIILIHENAAVVTPEHKEQEKSLVNIGSTMTGTAACAVQKMQRDPGNLPIAKHELLRYVVTAKNWFDLLKSQERIQLAIPQGHSLSINHGFYPYCTSRNTSPQQGLADAGIPIKWVDKVIACMRTFPIRVSNRFDTDGKMIGWSGPCYDDQKELTWAEVGQPPEMTSVSKKIRRVFSFSEKQYFESCMMNGATDVFMNFMNYLDPLEVDELFKTLTDIHNSGGPRVSWLGYGPRTEDIATVKIIHPTDDIDGREGCHPTMVGLERG